MTGTCPAVPRGLGFLAVALALPLTAQRTWIVDPNGSGPFLDLQTAITAASPGDTILVRGGSHGNVVVDRSVHLLADGARFRVGFLSCWPGTVVTVAGMDCTSLVLPACLASFDDVTVNRASVTDASAVFVRCTFDASGTGNGTTSIASSQVVFDTCALTGSRGFFVQTLQCTAYPGAPGLVVDGSSIVDLAATTCTGGSPFTIACLNSPGTNGIAVAAGCLVRASRSVIAGGGPGVAAVAGAGTVLGDATQFSPPFGATPAFLPITTGRSAAPGGVLTANVASDPLLPAAVVASLGSRAPVTLPLGTAWVDPSAFVVLRIGVLDGAGTMAVAVPLPPGLTRGIALTVQGVVSSPASAALTAASPTVLQVL